MKIESNHVVIDVTKGRKQIKEHVQNGGTVFVVIHGTIQGDFSFGNDDGVSQEFTLVPTLVSAAKPRIQCSSRTMRAMSSKRY